MMKTWCTWMMGLAVGIVFLTGCSSDENVAPKLKTYSRRDLDQMREIAMPTNYSIDGFRKLQMGVAVNVRPARDGKTGQDLAIAPGLSTRLQTEMAKLKRFTIFSAHNRGGTYFFEELADVDPDVNLAEPTAVKDIDLVLSAEVSVTKNRTDRYDDTLLTYTVQCDVSCEDRRTRTVKFAEKAVGRATRTQRLSYSGRLMVGFDASDEQAAINEAAMRALAVIANKLGNYYPVGGRISGASVSGSRLSLDKGFEDGIGNNQPCVIFVNDGGVDIPIATADATPSTYTSSLQVRRWNESDPDAKPLIDLFRKSPKDFIKNNAVYAVGFGLSTPPEWDRGGH